MLKHNIKFSLQTTAEHVLHIGKLKGGFAMYTHV